MAVRRWLLQEGLMRLPPADRLWLLAKKEIHYLRAEEARNHISGFKSSKVLEQHLNYNNKKE